jgi:hypothetical protein
MPYCLVPRFAALHVFVPFACLALAAACGPDGSPDAADDESSGSAGDSTGAPAPATTMPGTTTTAPPDTSGDDTGSTSTMATGESTAGASDEAGFIPRPDAGGAGDPYPLGEQCEADRECESGNCFMFGDFGFGICSECAHDSECMKDGGPGTCSISGSQWAVCSDGSAGSMCESSEGCAEGLVCAVIFEGSPFELCSACATDAECDEGSACAPSFGMGNICALPGTIENGEFCPEEGDAYCVSTHCTQAEAMGMPAGLWFCGECATDGDCAEGQTCMPAFVTNMDFGPSMCG